MTTTQYLLNAAVLLFVLGTNLGTRPLTVRRLAFPVGLVVVAATVFLGPVPAGPGDRNLVVLGGLVGVLLGIVAGLLVRVTRRPDHTLVTQAGWPYAALWTAVIGGRVLFAYGADHWYSRWIAEFSRTSQITGAAAWTYAFVLMALCMVLARVVVTAALGRSATVRPLVTA